VPNLVTSVARVRRLLRELQPDVVHAHVGQYAYAAVRAGYPTVYTIHGVLAREREVYRDTLFDRLRYGLLAHYEALALPRVDRLVAISPYVREAYAHVGGARWERIDNPVPQAFFDVQRRPEAGRVLFAGSITEIKDLLTLLRAIERVRAAYPAVHLRIAGRSTSEAYERRVHAFVEGHGLGETVAFLGLLDRQQLLDEYARCAALALSSVQENAPMAVIEAMAAGAPVVATRVGGVPDLVAEGETGYLVAAGDDAALADRLLALLRDGVLAARLGARGQETARGRFHADHVARAYYDLYHNVLKARELGQDSQD
jgi:glycosyltransferase involved in cell wall biosynthesis